MKIQTRLTEALTGPTRMEIQKRVDALRRTVQNRGQLIKLVMDEYGLSNLIISPEWVVTAFSESKNG